MKNIIKKILRENDLEWAENVVVGQELPFKILGPTKPPPTKKNIFVVKAKWMSGDADAYNTDEEWYYVDKPQEFEWFIDVCKVYGVLLKDRYGYHDWIDLNRILNPLGYFVYTHKGESVGKDVTDLINRDVFTDGQSPATLTDLKILYYNADGIEHNVKLT